MSESECVQGEIEGTMGLASMYQEGMEGNLEAVIMLMDAAPPWEGKRQCLANLREALRNLDKARKALGEATLFLPGRLP